MASTRTFTLFRRIALLEGASFLILLLIAMPLKYAAGLPAAVRIVGGLHGFLFVSFVALAFAVKSEFNRSWGWGLKAFASSIIPFGTFYMEKEWKQQELNIRK